MKLPHVVEPMLAVPGDPFDSASHIFEPKWDGIRCIVHKDDATSRRVRLQSRNLRDISAQFPELTRLTYWSDPGPWILDGEIVCLDDSGRPSFDHVRDRLLLKSERNIRLAQKHNPAVFVIFDVLFHRGQSVMTAPLAERKKIIQDAFRAEPGVLVSPWVVERGLTYFAHLAEQHWEGMVAKDVNSPYTPGKRSLHWIKVRRTQHERFYIVGWVPRGKNDISSLALAQPTGEAVSDVSRYKYVGHVGTGLRTNEREFLAAFLRPDPSMAERLENLPTGREIKTTIWTRPILQCEVEFLMWTRSGLLRHPVFRRLLPPTADHR